VSHHRQGTPSVLMPAGSGRLMITVMVLFAALLSKLALGNSSGPQPRLTGGFQEGTCVRCHNAHGLNDGRLLGGVFKVDGAPRSYQAGQTYPITVAIAHPGQSRWGFELTSRFAESGKQAGALTPADKMTQVKTDADIQYAMHTAEGTRKGEKDGPIEFHLNWTAPATPGGMVIFNATGNAADGSDSPTGDFIYSAGNFSKPSGAAQAEPEPVEISATPVREPMRLQETSRIANLPAPVDLKRGSVEIVIQHRFLESIADAGAGNAFGIDSGANINLGMNYALTNRLSVGLARARFDQIVELSGTYEIRTAKESMWKLALRGGVEGKKNFEEEYSTSLQLASSFDFGRVRLNVVPTVVFNTRSEALLQFNRARAVNPDSNNTFALGFGTDMALTRKLSLMAEYVPRLAGFGGFDGRQDQVAGGFVIRTWGHVFTILVSTSRDFTPAKYGVNSENRDVSLGFNLYRRIH